MGKSRRVDEAHGQVTSPTRFNGKNVGDEPATPISGFALTQGKHIIWHGNQLKTGAKAMTMGRQHEIARAVFLFVKLATSWLNVQILGVNRMCRQFQLSS
jgi:hypothetical protein